MDYISRIIDNYDAKKEYSVEELDDFYAYSQKSKKYICCSNSTGDCWVEEFNTREAVDLYFYSDCPLEDIYKWDRGE